MQRCWIPVLSLAGIVILSFFFGRDLDSPITGYLWAICCLSLSSFWEMTRWAMTEMPYIFFSFLGLYLLLRFLNSRSDWILFSICSFLWSRCSNPLYGSNSDSDRCADLGNSGQ